MKPVVLFAAALLATPAGAVTYEYVGGPLYCSDGELPEGTAPLCPFGPTLPGFSGFTFEATPPEANYRYYIGYSDLVYGINDNGESTTIECYPDSPPCDVSPPYWLSGEDIDPFFDGHNQYPIDYDISVLSLNWTNGRLTEWYLFKGVNGCGDTTHMLITNTDLCYGTDAVGDAGYAYLAEAPGEWITTPAPIPLPATVWLLLGALGGGAALTRGRIRAT